jgi:Tfp pilus assembly protein PilN
MGGFLVLINLLPQSARLKNQYYHLLRYYLKVWSLAGAGGLLLVAAHLWNLYQAKLQLNSLAVRSQPVYSLQDKLSDDCKKIKFLKAECTMLEQLQPIDHSIELLGILVKETQSEPGTIQLQRLSLTRSQPLEAATANPKSQNSSSKGVAAVQVSLSATGTLQLNGVAENEAALAKFVSGLRSSGAFERVDLKSSAQNVAANRSTQQYQLECRYKDIP